MIPRVRDFTELVADTSRVGSRVGTGGMRTKVEAARIATSGGVSVVLAHAAEVSGELRIDAGAARAVRKGNASLLAVGVDDVTGDFEAGDPVDITGPGGTLLARGVADCSATELRRRMDLGGLAVHRDLMIGIH